MRDNHLQTPQKEHQVTNRRSKQAKKPQKISKRSLNSVFTTVSEDVLLESPKDSINFSSISEVSDDNQFGDSAESFIASNTPALSPSSETVSMSDLTPLSSTVTVDKHEINSVSVNRCGSAESSSAKTGSIEAGMSLIASTNSEFSPSSETVALSDLTPLSSVITVNQELTGSVSVKRCRSAESNSVKIGFIEAEMVMNHLRQARMQILNSGDADLQSKKLLDALIQVVIEELCGLPEEKHQFAELCSTKAHLVLLSFFLWILAVVVVFFFSSGVQSSFDGPPPT